MTRILKTSAAAKSSGREALEPAHEIAATGRADDEYKRLIEWWDSSMRSTRDRAPTVSRTVIHDG
jgi:hypothetical protein